MTPTPPLFSPFHSLVHDDGRLYAVVESPDLGRGGRRVAVVWDADHDLRAVGFLDVLLCTAPDLHAKALFVAESQGTLVFVSEGQLTPAERALVVKTASNMGGDCWVTGIAAYGEAQATGDWDGDLDLPLMRFVAARWKLGFQPKPAAVRR